MKINLIKSLSNIAEQIEIEAGLPAYKAIENIDFENAVLIVNGTKQTSDYIFKSNDIVTVRAMPADLTDTPWWVSTFFIPFGFIIQPAELAYKARKEAEQAEKELEKIKKLTNAADIDNRPFLRGASNTIATGKSQPYLCGRNFLTLYLFSKPYYKISGADGEKQEVFNILEGGFKGIVLNKLGIGDTVIKTFSDTTPQNGVYEINDGLFADGIVEIRQNGEQFSTLTELNNKVVSNVINREIERSSKVSAGDAEYLIFSLDPNAQSVEIAIKFPYGLYAYNDDNDKIETSVTITPEYSLDGGSTYTTFSFGNGNTFKRKTTKELRYTANHDFTLSDYATLNENNQTSIIVRVRSDGNDDPKIKNDCYLFYYQSKIFDPEKSSAPAGVLDDDGEAGLVPCLNVENRERGFSCIIGMKLKATKNNEKKLTQINYIATSTARLWDGTAWGNTKQPTRNPAAIALEVLTSDIHPASRYNDSEIDLQAWGALYEKCERDGIKFDYVITQNQKKNDTLEKIATVCNAAIYKDIYGRISVAIDQPQENSIAVYNPQNIISITNRKTFSRRVDALRIKYIDSANDTFKENTYTVTRIENGQPVAIDENSIIKEVTATGITEHAQIVKYGRRLMAIDELRQITTTLQIGNEGTYYTPFAKISIQDPSLNRDAQDAVLQEVEYYGGLLKKIYLKTPVTFTTARKYGVIVNCTDENGAHPLALKISGSGTTSVLQVETKYREAESVQPAKNNVLSFGELDNDGEFSKITHDYIITRIERAGAGFTLDLQEYNPAIYESGEIPPYKPIINNTPTPPIGEIPIDAVTRDLLEQRIDRVNGDAVQAAIDTVSHGGTFTNVYRVRPPEMTLEEIVAKMDADARNASASISISEDEILLKVEDLDEQQRAFIAITKDQILSQVDDMAAELTGLIDIQAGAVTALVEGGGATGEMSLSLNLPIMITAETRAKFVAASGEDKVAAVYAQIAGSNYYGIRGNAGNTQVKALWDDAVAAGLLASQIVLNADQIQIAGKTIYTSNKTSIVASEAAASAQSNAVATAAADATQKANAAQSAAVATAASQREEMATMLGYASYNAMVQAASKGQTIIDGGYLRTALIDVEKLLAQSITLRQQGYIQSANYAESDGYPTAGFKLDAGLNIIKAYQMKAVGGDFKGIKIDTNSVLTGFLQTNNISTKTIAGVYFIDQDTGNEASSTTNVTMGQVAYSRNVKRVVKCGKGKYVIVFKDLDIDYGEHIETTAFACKIIRASDRLYSVKNPNGYTLRYGKCTHKCFVQTAQVKRNEETGNFEIDDNSYVCTTLDANNYPIAMSSNWWNGGYPEEWTENGVRYWAIGITATDNSSDGFVSLVGGCQLIIEASRLV